MTGKAVQRMLLVALLLAVAHAVKPFSLRNMALHVVRSAPSFSFVLPGSVRGGVEEANHLALTLGRGWRPFETRRTPEIEADWPTSEGEVIAAGAAPQPEGAEVCEKPERRPARRATPPLRDGAAQKAVAGADARRQAAEAARDSIKDLIASNALRLEAELQAVELPSFKNFTPIAIPLPERLQSSQCDSRQLKQASAVARGVRGEVGLQRAQSAAAPRTPGGEARRIRVVAPQRVAQSFRTMLTTVAAKRVLANCSTTFSTQSGVQISFRCS